MFRRKEESFDFDGETPSAEGQVQSAGEAATTKVSAADAQHSSVSESSALSAPQQPQAPVRSAPSMNAAPSFRPAASVPPVAPSNNSAPAVRPAAPAAPSMAMKPAGMGTGGGAGSGGVGGASTKASKRILTVGNDILLKGEIATCDRLVIEGAVDATLKDVHTVEIAESGSFKGVAEIEDAEISGLFEGDLVVRNRLTIYSTGRVRGKISYGEIEIERGGEMSGDITHGSKKKD